MLGPIISRSGPRTFTTSFSSDVDSALTALEGLIFDGNRKNQGPYTKYEQEQSHLVFLAADPAHKGKLRALVKDCHFQECVADGLSVYTNVDVEVQDCSSFNCFRGGFVLTGGNTKAAVKGFTSDGTEHSVGFDIEVDGAGYGKTYRVELTMERLRLKDGHFDIGVQDGSKVEVRDAVSRSGFCLCAPNATLKTSDSDLGVGRFSDTWNRIVFPGKTTFQKCRFTLRPELNEPAPAPKKWAAIHIYWNSDFAVDERVGRDDITYGIYAERDGLLNNSLSLCNCTFSDRFHTKIEMLGGSLRTSTKKGFPAIRCEGVYRMHLQGICTDEKKSIFWSFTDVLVKTEPREIQRSAGKRRLVGLRLRWREPVGDRPAQDPGSRQRGGRHRPSCGPVHRRGRPSSGNRRGLRLRVRQGLQVRPEPYGPERLHLDGHPDGDLLTRLLPVR